MLMQLNQRLGASVGGANPRSGSVGAMRSTDTRRRDQDDGFDGDEGGRGGSRGQRGRGGWAARWNPFARNPNRRVSIESPYADNSMGEQDGGAGSHQRRSAWDKGGSGASKAGGLRGSSGPAASRGDPVGFSTLDPNTERGRSRAEAADLQVHSYSDRKAEEPR